jgi:hypothetical protein
MGVNRGSSTDRTHSVSGLCAHAWGIHEVTNAARPEEGRTVRPAVPGAGRPNARPVAVVEVDGERLPVVVPRGDWITGRDFDMAMAEARMFRYIRPAMPGDTIPPDAAPGVVRVGGNVS